MLSPGDTVYPLLSASPTARELDASFTPDLFELAFAEKHTRQSTSLVGLLLLLKTFQRLGYFVQVGDIPSSIVRKVSHAAGLQSIPESLATYDSSTARGLHMALVRSYVGVAAFDRDALKLMLKSCVDASRVREDLADIINIAIEELFRHHRELGLNLALAKPGISAK